MLLDSNIPWSEKRLWQAKSNGCFQPNQFLKEVAAKHPEVTDPEEIARLAFIEYSGQNFVFGLMKQWAGQKDDEAILIDMTETPYPRPAGLKFEKEYVPESFAKEGSMATGMARDPAFYITERVARILDYKISDEARRTRFAHALYILEQQVGRSNTMDDLYTNFFNAIKPRRTAP